MRRRDLGGRPAGRARPAPTGARYDEAMETVRNAFGLLESRLAQGEFLLESRTLTRAADVHLWTTLLHVDAVHRLHLRAEDVRALAEHTAVWDYFSARLLGDPRVPRQRAPRPHRRPPARSTCRGPAAGGGAVSLVAAAGCGGAGGAPPGGSCS
ncbi:glutathione S-transferase C-terminal domain-containing protein [Yinghuangia aomiensis]